MVLFYSKLILVLLESHATLSNACNIIKRKTITFIVVFAHNFCHPTAYICSYCDNTECQALILVTMPSEQYKIECCVVWLGKHK